MIILEDLASRKRNEMVYGRDNKITMSGVAGRFISNPEEQMANHL